MPYAAVNDIQDTLHHSHGEPTFYCMLVNITNPKAVQARGMVVEVEHPYCGPMKLVNTPIKYSEAEPGVRLPPPSLGQHTNEILRSVLEYNDQDISSLREQGVIS